MEPELSAVRRRQVSVARVMTGGVFCLLAWLPWATGSPDASAEDKGLFALGRPASLNQRETGRRHHDEYVRVEGELLSVSLYHRPLRDVITVLELRSTLHISTVGDVGRREISMRFEELSLEEGVSRLLRGTNHAFVYSGKQGRVCLDEVIVLAAGARRPTEAGARRPDETPRPRREPGAAHGSDSPVASERASDGGETTFLQSLFPGAEEPRKDSDGQPQGGLGLALMKAQARREAPTAWDQDPHGAASVEPRGWRNREANGSAASSGTSSFLEALDRMRNR